MLISIPPGYWTLSDKGTIAVCWSTARLKDAFHIRKVFWILLCEVQCIFNLHACMHNWSKKYA